MAAFPQNVKYFTTKENVVHVVDADHPNTSEAEITAIETTLGTNPHQSAARATNYTTVDARLEAIEADYRLKTDNPPHGALPGLGGDDHGQYLRTDGTRSFTGMTGITAVPGTIGANDSPAEGTAMRLARSDHRHGIGFATAGGSAVGDTADPGATGTTTFAKSDHRHGREAFGAVTPITAFGTVSANGTATTVARSDHNHGSPALSSTAPGAEDYGSAGATGTATTAARADHVHAMPALTSTAPVTQAFGDAAAVGIATTPARADHRHGMPALANTVTDERTWGLTPAAGSATTASRSDHTHGSPDATLTGPSGTICIWPTNTPPSGWLICDGAAVSRTTYGVLWTLLGTTYGAGDGTTTFNLPNLKGRVVVGRDAADTDWDTLGETRGAKTHTLSAAEMPTHSHTVNSHSHTGNTGNTDPSHSHTISYEYVTSSFMAANWEHDHFYDDPNRSNIGLTPGSNQYALNPLGDRTGKTNTDHQHSANHGHSAGTANINHSHPITAESPGTNNAGSGSAHNNIQPSFVLNFIIKT